MALCHYFCAFKIISVLYNIIFVHLWLFLRILHFIDCERPRTEFHFFKIVIRYHFVMKVLVQGRHFSATVIKCSLWTAFATLHCFTKTNVWEKEKNVKRKREEIYIAISNIACRIAINMKFFTYFKICFSLKAWIKG